MCSRPPTMLVGPVVSSVNHGLTLGSQRLQVVSTAHIESKATGKAWSTNETSLLINA